MIYSEIKTLLEGYVEYAAFIHGIDFRLRWNKKLRQFELLVKNPVRESIFGYLTLLEFEMGDIKSQCTIQINRFKDHDMFNDMRVELDKRNYRYMDRIFGGKYEIEVAVINKEGIREILDMLEKIEYFDRWR